MNDVTAHASERTALPYAETGWAEARRRHGRGPRTCRPAVLKHAAARRQGEAAEDNIVRGDD
ncbi:hypothetical protein SAMN05428944_1130 [Streptomyces sp. 1222.5]|uniref:hypothetical protein n=1 Tax=unclassified Streptomyces TaxID=2593676 RepID=UPI00089B5F8E|nr:MULTISPECIES: hypothetical protein [unclassified Streptomyces]PKW11649.1 hypothetical protein BX260_6965 [Streptomyces sp. 5112.2]SEB73395.1 hypothetical protein SAMN05428944_1130 [Streptomyces sp. 1222.5]SEE17048.1 hypothetical protein SAMN05216532_7191 [Streptomyces sp. 2231.1]